MGRLKTFDALVLGSALHTMRSTSDKEAAKNLLTKKWEDRATEAYKKQMGSLIQVIST